jgi:hypothetical protein
MVSHARPQGTAGQTENMTVEHLSPILPRVVSGQRGYANAEKVQQGQLNEVLFDGSPGH